MKSKGGCAHRVSQSKSRGNRIEVYVLALPSLSKLRDAGLLYVTQFFYLLKALEPILVVNCNYYGRNGFVEITEGLRGRGALGPFQTSCYCRAELN